MYQFVVDLYINLFAAYLLITTDGPDPAGAVVGGASGFLALA